MREYFKREHVGPLLRFLRTVAIVVGAILVIDVIGLWVFLLSKGQWTLPSFIESLTILLLLEGALIGAIGGFMYVGYGEYGVVGQAAINPAIAREQLRGWRERRLSQQKWGVAMLIVGVTLIFLGLLVSSLAQ